MEKVKKTIPCLNGAHAQRVRLNTRPTCITETRFLGGLPEITAYYAQEVA